MVGVIVVVGYLGFNLSDFVVGIVVLVFGLVVFLIFLVLMMGIFNKCVNKEGVIVGMFVGISVILLYVF